MKRWFKVVPFLILLGLGRLYAGTTGKIMGKVIDKETGEPLIGAGVRIVELGRGTITDMEGNYVLLNVPPGTYTLKATYVGYNTMVIEGVRVDADRTTEINFYMTKQAIKVKEVVVKAKPKAIKKDLTSSRTITTAEDIQDLPVTDVTDVISRQAGVSMRGGVLHIRGGRPGEVSFSIDGVEAKDPYSNASSSNVPLLALQEASVERGGFDVDQGSAASGVIQIITREGGPKYELSLMPYTNDLSILGDKVYSFFDANVGDPYLDYLLGKNIDITINDTTMTIEEASATNRHKTKAKTLEFSFGGPLIPKYRNGPRFFISGMVERYKGTYPVSFDPEYYNKSESYQWKLSWQILKNMKIFTSGLYRYSNTKGYSPAWRLALDNLPVYKSKNLQFAFGINFFPTTRSYIEFRVGGFNASYKDNIIEDADRDGIDDFADRDGDGLVEVDLDYFTDSLGNKIDPKTLYPGAEVHEAEGYVELPYYWWESEILKLYPSLGSGPVWWSVDTGYKFFPRNRIGWGQRSRADINVVEAVVNGKRDTLIEMSGIYFEYPFIPDMIKMHEKLIDTSAIDTVLDTLLTVGNQYLPDPHTYPRNVWYEGYSKTLSMTLKYTAQITSHHEILAGVEYKRMDVMRYSIDYASGGNIYMTLVNNDFGTREGDNKDNFIYWLKDHKLHPYQFAAYLRDKIEVEGMVAKIGFRYDYFNSGGYVISDSADPFVADPQWLFIKRIKDPKPAGGKQHLSPRIGISFPISERDVLHFTYGHYMQPPALYQMIGNYVFSGAFPIIGNADLDPEITISYEFGVKHAFNENTIIDVSAYYKDIKNWARLKMIHYGVSSNYSTYVNEDYGDVRGIEVNFSKRPGGSFLPYFGLDVNYTFQVALGTFSSPFDAYDWAWRGYPMPPHESPLDWDQRHSLQVALSFIVPPNDKRFGKFNNWGITIDHSYGSGYPYTPPIKTPREAIENINAERYPATHYTNLRVFKAFRFAKGKVNLRFFMDIENLFNKKNLLGAANIDWYVYFNNPEGEERDPTVWSNRRRTRVGFMLNVKGF